ncbi:MAG: hypothetical protein FWF86_03835 [Clostridia bacterium]|nr:hypothetical protein [Clostridia bacterium]
MNGQERMEAIHKKQPHDRAPICTLVDDISRMGMSRRFREMTPIEFYKYLGYDIYQFGNYGLPEAEQVKYPYNMVKKNVIETFTDLGDGYTEAVTETERGILTGKTYRGHPVKYPVENLNDVKILTEIWRNTEYAADLEGCGESYERMAKLMEGYGVYVPVVYPSALQKLLEEDIGAENFYYMLQDYPREIHELIEIMHDRRCQEYRLVAKHMPYDACITCENTSTTYISPALYRQISQRHMKDFVDIMHAEGKMGILHMCGYINDLLYDFIPTGLDGIHGLTEPPVGNTLVADALDILEEDMLIVTGLDSTKVLCPDYSPDRLIAHMEEFITDRLKKANIVFGIAADGLTTPLDRFITVGEWFATRGYPGGGGSPAA